MGLKKISIFLLTKNKLNGKKMKEIYFIGNFFDIPPSIIINGFIEILYSFL